jgi:hypothetical protein
MKVAVNKIDLEKGNTRGETTGMMIETCVNS